MSKPMIEPSALKRSRRGPDAEVYRALIDNTRDYAILMLDPEGHVISWNEGAEAIKGYTADEIIGSHFSCFYPADAIERDLPQKQLAEAAAAGTLTDEGWRLSKGGSGYCAHVVIARMLDGQGGLMGVSMIAADSTTRRGQ